MAVTRSSTSSVELSACTIVSRNYLSHALILAESFTRHEGGRFYLLVVDRIPPGVEIPPYVELIDPDDLQLPYLYEMCFKYDVTELSTAVKPTLLAHLMEVRGERRVAYLDPDILVTRPLTELHRSMRRASIVLIPHLLDDIPLDNHRPNEQDILIAGSYNLGFLGLRQHKDTARLLDWWAERLRDLCRVSPSEGLMTDQRWIDLVPGYFSTSAVLRDDTYDVAYWNLHSRKLGRASDGGFTVNGRPLAFFHFSGFNPTKLHTLSKHQDRHDPRTDPVLADLLGLYAELHERHGYAESSQWGYGYSTFSNGIAVHPILRQLYLGLEGDARQRFGDPFRADGELSFLRWAVEPRGEELSLFLASLYRLRYDVMAAFPEVNGRDRASFIDWARSQGTREERFDPALVCTTTSAPILDVCGEPLGAGEAAPAGTPIRDLALSTPLPEPAGAAPPAADGFNVVGYLRSESGLGAAARGYVRALRSAEVPFSLIDVGHLSANRSEDRSLGQIDNAWDHGVNLVVVNADEHFHVASELGEQQFRSRYNVGVWAWELPEFPTEWHDRFPWYDEIWVGSSFIAGALAKVAPMPVVVVPPVLAADKPGSRKRGRARIGAAGNEFIFTFVFDFHSFFERKNPLATVEAFTRAFSNEDNARLIIKCVNPQVSDFDLGRLQTAGEGHRIDIHAGYWPVEEVRDLMAATDAYVSLHRSEGTGITLSDAMGRAKPVIATGWSGNTDFMNVSNSYPVDYRLVTIEEDLGPYRAGQVWAEPSVDHAALLMRRVFDDRRDAQARARRSRSDIETYFSEQRVGELVAGRLAMIAETGARRRASTHGSRKPAAKGHPNYAGLVGRLRAVVQEHTPPEATVAVISRGDNSLLELDSRAGWHFPRTGDGAYAGYYPSDSEAAIAHLEQLRANGASHLAVPASSGWWLEHYDGFREHLESRYEVVYDDPATGTLFRLARPRRADLSARLDQLEKLVAGSGSRRINDDVAASWSTTLIHPFLAQLDQIRSETETRTAELTERLREIERLASGLDRRLQAGAAWADAVGDSSPAEIRRLHEAHAHQVDRISRLELALAGQAEPRPRRMGGPLILTNPKQTKEHPHGTTPRDR